MEETPLNVPNKLLLLVLERIEEAEEKADTRTTEKDIKKERKTFKFMHRVMFELQLFLTLLKNK
jgi:hypothetical protein